MSGGAILVALGLVFVLTPPAAGAASSTRPQLALAAVSNRADLVSGGDVLVRATLPRGVRIADAALSVDGARVRDQLHATGRAGVGFARVTGLARGPNRVSVTAGGETADLVVTNHPIGGPVFAGPQVQPWLCATVDQGLGAPRDAQCNVAPEYELLYKSSITQQFQPYNPVSPPFDLDVTTTDQGVAMPYVIRVERGVIDRGIYAIAVLFNPAQPWEPWAPQPGWNGKVVVPFGGDCQPRHGQGAPESVTIDDALSRGFATLTSNLNVLGQNCNDVVSAEALMMLKEHFVERYGPVRYTISQGCSGGSMQQNWIASNYPGLLDGLQPSCTYPDIWQTMQEAEDCHLLDRVFDQASPHLWLVVQQQAFAAGYQAPTTCRSLWDLPITNAYSRLWLDPDNFAGCLGSGPSAGIGGTRPAWVYDAVANRKGARCTLPDYMVSVFGRRPSDGFANRPYDNVGVQYGLAAVETGQILAEQFVDLNEKVGGLDIDWNWQPQRSVADDAALRIAYRSGRVSSMREAAQVPIIDLPLPENLEIHTPFHSDTVRARLRKANGHADNHVIWSGTAMGAPADSLVVMDRWLAAVEADTTDAARAEKVARNKPPTAVDSCWVATRQVFDLTLCRVLYPTYADPRIVAGAPIADDILKCQLKPLRRGDYKTGFSDAQWARLQKAFPGGVCDYRRPGVHQQPSLPWLTYTHGPGGRPLGPAPRARVQAH